MNKKLVNNWEAANELERFKQRYCDPQYKKVKEAKVILDNPDYKWEKGQKERAIAKFNMLDTKNIDYYRLYSRVYELVKEHERQTNMLTQLYAEWIKKVAPKGKQPTEMMDAQAEVLQSIFQKIFDAIEPLKLDLIPPKK